MTTAIALTELKETVAKAVNKRTATIAKANQVEPDALTIDLLGDDWIIRNIQWRAQISHRQFTLGELQQMLDNLSSVCQFEVAQSRVEALLTGSKSGIFKATKPFPLYMEPEIIHVKSSEPGEEDEFFIGGGRHRVVALLTGVQSIRGWRELLVNCRVYTVRDKVQALEYIKNSNGSRSMTTTEQGQLDLGMSISSHTTSEFFEEARKSIRNATEAVRLNAFGMGQLIFDLPHHNNQSDGRVLGVNQAGELAKKFLGAFVKMVNTELQAKYPDAKPKASISKLMHELTQDDNGEDSTFMQEIARYAAQRLREDWEYTYYPMCEVQTAKGKQYLLGRALPAIAKALAIEIAGEFSETLIQAYETYVLQAKEESEAKKAENAQKKAEQKRKQALAVIAMLEEQGGDNAVMITNIKKAAGIK